MKPAMTLLLSLALYLLSPAIANAQLPVPNIDDFQLNTGGQNCTPNKVYCSPKCWEWAYDSGIKGSPEACVNGVDVSSPSKDGNALEGEIDFVDNYAGGRFNANLGVNDTTDTAFKYDIWVQYNDLSHVNNLEFDLNQVLANGDTVIFGTQCVFDSGHWQYTTNTGTPAHPIDTWNTSSATCSKSDFSVGSWHHVIVSFKRASACTPSTWQGNCTVTYVSVKVDANLQTFTGAHSGPDEFTLAGWPVGGLIVNIQVDGDKAAAGHSMDFFADVFTVRQ